MGIKTLGWTFLAVTVCVFALARTRTSHPSDLRDAPTSFEEADAGKFETGIPKVYETPALPAPRAMPVFLEQKAADQEVSCENALFIGKKVLLNRVNTPKEAEGFCAHSSPETISCAKSLFSWVACKSNKVDSFQAAIDSCTGISPQPVSCESSLFIGKNKLLNRVGSHKEAVDLCAQTPAETIACAKDLFSCVACKGNRVDSFKAAVGYCMQLSPAAVSCAKKMYYGGESWSNHVASFKTAVSCCTEPVVGGITESGETCPGERQRESVRAWSCKSYNL